MPLPLDLRDEIFIRTAHVTPDRVSDSTIAALMLPQIRRIPARLLILCDSRVGCISDMRILFRRAEPSTASGTLGPLPAIGIASGHTRLGGIVSPAQQDAQAQQGEFEGEGRQ